MELTSKSQIFELLKKERYDFIFHKAHVSWKNEFGFYCIYVSYENNPKYCSVINFNDEILNGVFPYPLEEYKKLSDIDRKKYDETSKIDLERFKILLKRSVKLNKIIKNINEYLDN